ncbi:MAG TPA: glycosyltransferase family 4 protein [Thermoleophilia bacterium]
MHILVLSHYFVPENNAPAARVHSLAREWTRQGHCVTVITGAPNVPTGVVFEGYRNRLLQQEWIDGIRTVRVWTYLAANRGRVRRGFNFLSYLVTAGVAGALLRPRADVVIATSPQFFAGCAGVPVSRAHGAPFVLEIRDIWPASIIAVGALKEGRVVRVLERLERALYAAADHIVTVGAGYRQHLLDRGVPGAKVEVVTNGVDADLFVPRAPDEALRARLGLSSKYVVTYAGTVGMAHGLNVVLRAGNRLREHGRDDIVFLIVGEGARRAELEQATRDQGLHNVVFTGMVGRAQLPVYLASSDACLVHMRDEALFSTVLPSKIFEDAAMEKPVIAGLRGEGSDIIRAADCGVVFAPDDDAALTAAVERLADDPEEGRRLGRNGRRFVTEHYDRRRLAHEYLAILERVRADFETRR